MKTVRIHNITRDTVLADRALLADNALTRMRGLLGRPCPGAGEGMVIVPCNQVHTVGMGYAIDVCYAARDGEVLRILPNLQPWRMTWPCPGAYWTVELAPGGLGGTEVGDILEIRSI